MATAIDRVSWYRRRFPRYPPPQSVGDKLYGVFMIGNFYKRINPLYGAYPHGYLERMCALFPELPRLHVFSGGVIDTDGITFDINPFTCPGPDVVGDAIDIANYFKPGQFTTVFADPPYDARARKVYGTEPFCKRRAIAEIAKVVRPGGHLLWLDTKTPIWSKRDWTWGGLIGLHTGTNCVMRCISILRRRGVNGEGLFD